MKRATRLYTTCIENTPVLMHLGAVKHQQSVNAGIHKSGDP